MQHSYYHYIPSFSSPCIQVQQCSSLKCPRDGAKVLDVEWASSDKPILASIDGCIRVADIPMKTACGPFEDSALSTPVFAPHLLSARYVCKGLE